MTAAVHDAIAIFSVSVVLYFVCWNLSQLLMSPAASVFLWRHRHRYTPRALALADRLARPPVV